MKSYFGRFTPQRAQWTDHFQFLVTVGSPTVVSRGAPARDSRLAYQLTLPFVLLEGAETFLSLSVEHFENFQSLDLNLRLRLSEENRVMF
jgi:hypothetical protein